MTTFYRLAADAIVIVHLAYAATIVIGLIVTWIGILLRQSWARNFWWRIGHLVMMLIVVVETWIGMTCPLTTWENQLRVLAKQDTIEGDFIANYVHRWLFYDFPTWVFTAGYTIFGLLVVGSFLIAPPRFKKGLKGEPEAPAP